MTFAVTSRARLVLVIGALALLAVFPFLGGLMTANSHEFYMQQLTTMMILGLFCMSLDLLVGIAGLVSLGHAAFFGLGAYLLVLATPDYGTPSILIHVPLALAGVALAALATGALALRTGGVYFIMVTLAVGQMFFYLFNDSKMAGGSDGAYLYFKPVLSLGGATLLDFDNKRHFYLTTLAVLVVSYLLLRAMLEAPFGKVIRGIGINENRTRGLGYDVYAYKLVAFVVAAVFAGLAGILSASQYGFVNPGMLGWHMSGSALVTVILGGAGTLAGPIVGAFLIEMLRQGLERMSDHWLLPFGGLIILMVLVLPRGLAGLLARERR